MLLVTVLVLVLVALGNSATATKLATARKIEINGAVKGSSEFDGGNNINIITEQNNIAIINGKITLQMEAGNSIEIGEANVEYPFGFTKDNCIIICIIARKSDQTSNIGYSYGILADENYSAVINSASMGKCAILEKDFISLTMRYNWNGTMQSDRIDIYDYKIILMKRPTLVEGVDYILGDVNGDGKIDSEDVQAIKNYIMGQKTFTNKEFKAADVNKDGEITSTDYARLKNYVEGKIDSLD